MRFLKLILQKSLLVMVLFVFLSLPLQSFAAPYGEGVYGAGLYGVGQVAPTSQPNPGGGSSGSSGGGGGGQSSGCSEASPTNPPDLFQIDAKNTQARIYFAPAGSNISSYYLSFGLGNLDEGYGAPLNIDARGAAYYDVTYLKPNTTYTFKIRGANGCAAGPWSNSLRARTTGSAKTVAKFYPQKQAASSLKNTVSGIPQYITNKVSAPFKKTPTTPTTQSAPQQTAPQQPKQISVPVQSAPKPVTPPQPKQSLFDKVKSFFGF